MDNLPSITSVIIKRVAKPITPVIAYITITIENCLAIHDIKLLKFQDGRRHLAFPNTKITRDGVTRLSDIVHPINKEFRNSIEQLVFDLYDTGKDDE